MFRFLLAISILVIPGSLIAIIIYKLFSKVLKNKTDKNRVRRKRK